MKLVPVLALLLVGWVIGFVARPTYDHWAFDRYAQRMCAAGGKITTITDHQIMCGGRP